MAAVSGLGELDSAWVPVLGSVPAKALAEVSCLALEMAPGKVPDLVRDSALARGSGSVQARVPALEMEKEWVLANPASWR